MQIGTTLFAPEGYCILEKNIDYYFLRSSRVTHQVLLLVFAAPPRVLAHLVIIDRAQFERGLIEKAIVLKEGSALPPHLSDLAGLNLEAVDLQRVNARRSHRDRVQTRLMDITPLLDREDEILNSRSPEKEINNYAVANGKNSQRMRTWFFIYLCFGRNVWSLMPTFFRNGTWNRLQSAEGRKFGRPSEVTGAKSGARMTDVLVKLIIESYSKRAQSGHSLVNIYRESMIQDFGARVITDERGRKRMVSTSLPIPSLNQYRYQVHKIIGIRQVQLNLYGKARYRRNHAQHQGAFASSVANLCDRVEADGYYTRDCPSNYLDGAALSPLSVVRGVDTVSGLRIGIGFAFGKEKSSAYNAMLFCAAIPKKKFCSLFGIEIEEADWPSVGLPPHYITDRGPGVKREPGAQGTEASFGMTIREIAVSGSGQSKSIAESAQRRTIKLEEPETKLISQLSPFEMARREIRRLLSENQDSLKKSRLTPEMIRDNVFPNPLGIWHYLDERARNSAQAIPFDEAVRRFLNPIEVRVNRSGAYIKHQKYHSPALEKTRFLDKVGNVASKIVKGYILPFAVRFIWLEIEGHLVEVEAQLAILDDTDQLNRTYDDLLHENRRVKHNEAAQRLNADAARAEQISKFEHETGKKWRSSKRVSVRGARTKATTDDVRDVQTLLEGEVYSA